MIRLFNQYLPGTKVQGIMSSLVKSRFCRVVGSDTTLFGLALIQSRKTMVRNMNLKKNYIINGLIMEFNNQ